MSKEFSELNGYGVKDAVARADIATVKTDVEQLKNSGGSGGKRYMHNVEYFTEKPNGDMFEVCFTIVRNKPTKFGSFAEALDYAKEENMHIIADNSGVVYLRHDLEFLPNDSMYMVDGVYVSRINMITFQIEQIEITAGDEELTVYFTDRVTEV